MNILICSNFYKPKLGGIPEFMHQICLILSNFGHKIYIVGPEQPDSQVFDQKYKQFKIYRIKSSISLHNLSIKNAILSITQIYSIFGELLYIYKTLSAIVEENQINKIICFHWDFYGLLLYFLYRQKKIPYHIVAHGTEIIRKDRSISWGLRNSLQWFLQATAFSKATSIFANSSFTQHLVLNNITQKIPVKVTYCGVDTQVLIKKTPADQLVKKYKLTDKKIVLTLCRLVKRKGIDNTILAFKMLADESQDENIVYVIGGTGPDEDRLKQLVMKQQLQNRIFFLGHVPENDKPDLYNLCDVFVMPCREEGNDVEGLGIVYLEANACEKPVIGGDSGGVKEVIFNGYNGILVNPNNVDEIYRKLRLLLDQNDYAVTLGQQGRKLVEDKFSWDSVATRFLK